MVSHISCLNFQLSIFSLCCFVTVFLFLSILDFFFLLFFLRCRKVGKGNKREEQFCTFIKAYPLLHENSRKPVDILVKKFCSTKIN